MLAHATVLASLALLGQFTSAAPQAPGPSAFPECTYTCPTLDKAGWQGVPFMDPSPTEMFCSYPTVVNENPLDFYCIYSKIDAHLVFDHNAGLCQDYATCTFSGGRRPFRNGGGGSREPLPTRRPKSLKDVASDIRPSVMKTRMALGKGKRRPATKTTKG
ncbi:hypothetical protein NMY22_g6604 [Coprinellus aureogranulatus]|nr:hypothetical protein NMY22_g6604 [Coprinellus aureogranulatus]